MTAPWRPQRPRRGERHSTPRRIQRNSSHNSGCEKGRLSHVLRPCIRILSVAVIRLKLLYFRNFTVPHFRQKQPWFKSSSRNPDHASTAVQEEMKKSAITAGGRVGRLRSIIC